MGNIAQGQAARRRSCNCDTSDNKAIIGQRPNSLEEAIELLKNLSVVIDEKKKSQLLSSLTNVLCYDNSNIIKNATINDTPLSSFINTPYYQEPEYQCYEVCKYAVIHFKKSYSLNCRLLISERNIRPKAT